MDELKKECYGVGTDSDTTYDHIVKYTGLFGGAQVITLLISVVKTKAAAYLLGPAGIALLNIYNKVMGLVNQTTNFGISFSAVKHIAELSDAGNGVEVKRMVDTVRLWSLMAALFGFLVCLTLSPWISLWTFKSYEHTSTFCILSVVIAIMAVTGGEIAILKGLKQLKKVAVISVFSTFATLLVCLPCYFLGGVKGIVLSLLLSNVAILGIHLYYSSQVVPWSRSILCVGHIHQGIPMLKLGLAFIVAGMFGQGSDYFINAFILRHSGLDSVGFYTAGYFLATTIGSILFVSVEADYFPRLSALSGDVRRMNVAVNRQIEVCVLLIAPCLMLEVVTMPLLVHILYTAEFMQAVPMAVCAAFYLFFKAMTLPVAYFSLAKGDSVTFLITELVYDVLVAVIVPWAYTEFGLVGAGGALSFAGFFDFLFIHTYYRVKYGFRFFLRPLGSYVVQLFLLAACVFAVMQPVVWLRWLLAVGTILSSLVLSYHRLRKETDFLVRIKGKIVRKTK